MRYFVVLVFVFLLTGSALAGPKEFPFTAHVVGKRSQDSGDGTTSSYNSQTHKWSYGAYSSDVVDETDLLIGKLVYTVERSCKTEVGKDYPAYIETGKRRKHVYLQLPNGKTCRALVSGERER